MPLKVSSVFHSHKVKVAVFLPFFRSNVVKEYRMCTACSTK